MRIKFKKAEIDFIYTKNPIKDFEFKCKNFYVENFKRKYLNINGVKKYKILDKYQFQILNEISKYMKAKKTSLCDGVMAYKQQLILNQIING